MMRLIGAVLVAAGGAWLGLQAAETLHRRVREVRQMAQGLAWLESELELNAPPLAELLAQGSRRSRGPARVLFQDCARGLERLDEEEFSHLWRRLVEERTELGPEGQAVLIPLGDTLGRYETERQRACLSAASRQLEELAGRLERESRGRSRVYEALGLSGGVFLVILLL